MPFKIYLSQNNPSKTTPYWKWRHHLKSYIYLTHNMNQQAYGIVTTRTGVRWLIHNSSHCTQNMYQLIHTQVLYEFCVSFLHSWIDILALNQPFSRRAKIWEPFKINLYEGCNIDHWMKPIQYILDPTHTGGNLHERQWVGWIALVCVGWALVKTLHQMP